MSQAQNKAGKMTTEEAIGTLFPRRAVRTARRFADRSNLRVKRSTRTKAR